jgi:hypothetical protein
MKKLTTLAALLLVLCSMTYAWGDISVITFDAVDVDSQLGFGRGNYYYEGDYIMSGFGRIFNPFNQSPYSAAIPNDGTQHWGSGYDESLTMQRVDGAAFNVYSFDIARYSSVTLGNEFWFSANKADGALVNGTLPLTDLIFKKYSLNLKNITSLTLYSQSTGPFAVDNIHVPEPATFLLVGLGGILLRNRKKL